MNSWKIKPAALALLLIALFIAGLVGYSYLHEDTAADYSGQVESVSPNTTAAKPVNKEDLALGMPACVCHSKKPSMVRMHDALEGEDCGSCHKPDEDLMNPSRTASSPDDTSKRMSSEAICKECHMGDKTIVSNVRKGKVKISGALFCPTCKKQLTPDDMTCGDCGGNVVNSDKGWECSACGSLVDINKVAAISKEKPSNDICRLCHLDNRSLTVAHGEIEAYNKVKSKIPGGLSNCLACHKSHNQCGGCHF